jgi:hypothetical protein
MLPRAVLWPPRAKINLPAAISSYPETSLQPRPRHPIHAQGEPHKVGSITVSFLLTDLSRYIVDVSIGNVSKAR